MTNTLSSAAETPTAPNKPVGEGSVINGHVLVWMDAVSYTHLTLPTTPYV